jgi:hypothetical protein
MTSETRTTIEPNDFKAIEIECRKCKHRIIRPMRLWEGDFLACPVCGVKWDLHKETMEFLGTIAARVSGMANSGRDGAERPFIIRFEIEGSKSQ